MRANKKTQQNYTLCHPSYHTSGVCLRCCLQDEGSVGGGYRRKRLFESIVGHDDEKTLQKGFDELNDDVTD